MTPSGGGDPPAHGANQVNQEASVMAAAVSESRGVLYAFATSTKIHGMRNLYLARGQLEFSLTIAGTLHVINENMLSTFD